MLQEECEFGNRCKNSDKCYRCFNQKLLKLPEEKKFKRKKQTYDYSKANADDSWKDLEQQVADKLNYVPTIKEARRSRRSGALEFETGDVVDSILHPECKERKGRELKTGEKSFTVQKLWLTKAKHECENSNKKMCLPFRFKGDKDIYVIMDIDDLTELSNTLKAYMIDNDKKAKEIEILKKQLNLTIKKDKDE